MPRTKTGGRKRGTPNRLTRSARDAFQYAFDALGGSEGLAGWAHEHRSEFYRLYARQIPPAPPEPSPDQSRLLVVVREEGTTSEDVANPLLRSND